MSGDALPIGVREPGFRRPAGILRLSQMLLLFAVWLLSACAEGEESYREPAVDTPGLAAGAEEAEVPLPVDSSVSVSPIGTELWQFGRSSMVDVDGDGEPERVVVAARAEVVRGQPLWDDGQPWQVYVQESTGEMTLLFARYVQLGSVTARVTLEEPGLPTAVFIIEHLPDGITLYEIEYRGPGDASVRSHLHRRLDPIGDLASPELP